jgi:hypothetical protein
MAERWAVATGNWSNTATWNGGTLPGSTDDVYANGFTVTINQDVTANSLKTIAGTTAVAGGTFQSSGTYTIALQELAMGAFVGGTSNQILLLSGGAVTLNVAGVISGDTSTVSSEPPALMITGGTHSVTAASCTGFSGFAIQVNGVADVTVTSAVEGGSTSAILLANSGAQCTVHGSITGGNPGHGVQINQGVLRVDADLIYGPAGAAPVHGAASAGGVVFMRGGANLATTAPSDDNWPLDTGDPITLTAGGGGGVDPKRFLNVGGVATPIQ